MEMKQTLLMSDELTLKEKIAIMLGRKLDPEYQHSLDTHKDLLDVRTAGVKKVGKQEPDGFYSITTTTDIEFDNSAAHLFEEFPTYFPDIHKKEIRTYYPSGWIKKVETEELRPNGDMDNSFKTFEEGALFKTGKYAWVSLAATKVSK